MAIEINKSLTSIEYIVFSSDEKHFLTFIPPDALNNGVIEFIRKLPMDLMQMVRPINFYEIHLRTASNFGYDFKVINIRYFENVKDDIKSTNRVRLIFFDGSDNLHLEKFKLLSQSGLELTFFSFYNKKYSGQNPQIIGNPQQFVRRIIEEEDKIKKYLSKESPYVDEYFSFDVSLDLNLKPLADYPFFLPIQNNSYIAGNIIGNFCIGRDFEETEATEKHKEISTKAILNGKTFERQEQFLNSLDIIDYFTKAAYFEKLVKLPTRTTPMFAPLILVAPFHNPDLSRYNKGSLTGLLLEQSNNYTIEVITEYDKEIDVRPALHVNKMRLSYLDNISFLHAAFTYSPILRLPLIGKSINRDLSFFKPSNFPRYLSNKTRKKLNKTIGNFGSILANRTLSEKIQNVIKLRNSQIVVISDIPVEWMNIGGIPLAFTHDVCRLPETSLHGLMSFYSSNKEATFVVDKDIVKKTLVIFGCQEAEFTKWQPFIEEHQKEIGFKIAKCQSISDVKKEVEKVRPNLIIFDCHGGFDESTNSSFLYIGKEKLKGDDIVKNGIVAPLIFLSACGTAPTYGTMNPIANAFFQAGAYSVTSTFLPISVDSGTILYFRLLVKLKSAAQNIIHKNWLEFVCHIIRTSTINDAYMFTLGKYVEPDSPEFEKSNVEALIESQIFEQRRKLYHNLDGKISKLAKTEKDFYSSRIPEYLLYTNLGRGDLILFESWKEENNRQNVSRTN